jgi:DNA repair exonuclease SbcCD ATPase subunit
MSETAMSSDEAQQNLLVRLSNLEILVSVLSKDQTTLKEQVETLLEIKALLEHDKVQQLQEIEQLSNSLKNLENDFEEEKERMETIQSQYYTIQSEHSALKLKLSMTGNENGNNNGTSPLYSSNSNNIPTASASMRTIPAPSKVAVNDQKKKDNRLSELRRITREVMNVDDDEAGLRLYKLQKTMVHVVADLKNYMKERNEDITKSWKSIDMGTQRVAFEMVEREASSLGVPINMCIGYWGARRLISKSWANALRTTKKHITGKLAFLS